jgi:hypothetical protein
MDLNYLLARHQISLMRAKDTAGHARCSHHQMANDYAIRIEALKAQLGATFPSLAVS